MQNDREHLYEALDYVAKGRVRVMNELFPLEEICDAYDKVVNGNVRFKAVNRAGRVAKTKCSIYVNSMK
jgi:alcohol dehydrogenase